MYVYGLYSRVCESALEGKNVSVRSITDEHKTHALPKTDDNVRCFAYNIITANTPFELYPPKRENRRQKTKSFPVMCT